jgi:hypothetical protein
MNEEMVQRNLKIEELHEQAIGKGWQCAQKCKAFETSKGTMKISPPSQAR